MEEQICLWQLNQERSTNAIVFKKNYLKIDICECCRWAEAYSVDSLVKYKPNCKWLLGSEVPLCLHGKCSRSETHQDQSCQNSYSLLYKQYMLQTRWDIQWFTNWHKIPTRSGSQKVLQTQTKTVQQILQLSDIRGIPYMY